MTWCFMPIVELRFCGSVTCTQEEDSAVCDGSKHVREISNDTSISVGKNMVTI